MKIITYIAAVFSTLLVLAWPLVFFGTIFLFDEPLHGAADVIRNVLSFCLLAYPLGYVVALVSVVVRKASKRGILWWKPPVPYLFCVPVLQLTIVIILIAVLL